MKNYRLYIHGRHKCAFRSADLSPGAAFPKGAEPSDRSRIVYLSYIVLGLLEIFFIIDYNVCVG